MTATQDFLNWCSTNGSSIIFHREEPPPALYPGPLVFPGPSLFPTTDGMCPCRTYEGYRSPRWHKENPSYPICNEQGYVTFTTVHFNFKGSVQPISSAHATRMASEVLINIFGELQTDDHLGVFPIAWLGNTLNLWNWGHSGEDYIEYNSRRFSVVNVNTMPDPNGHPEHHHEVGLRLLSPRENG